MDLLNNQCFFSTQNNDDIYNILKSENINSYPEDGESIVIKADDNYIFHLTNGDNEMESLSGKFGNNYNLSIIDLGNCEKLLKEKYYINDNISLIILKFEKLTNIASEKNVQYEIYEPYNKTKLDLSICQNTYINLYIPIQLSNKTQSLYEDLKENGYDLFNINDSFYQDICTPYKTKDGTDILLSDRKKDYYYNNNDIICQANCEYSSYFSESKLLKCECNVVINEYIGKTNIDIFDGKKLYKSFYEVLKYSNYKVLKCFKLVFNINSITKNIGNIISLIYFAIYLSFLGVFIFKGFYLLKINVAKSFFGKLNNQNKINSFSNDKNFSL